MTDFMDQFRPPPKPVLLPTTAIALDDATTKNILGRYRMTAKWLMVIGFVLLVLFVVAASYVETSAQELLDYGTREVGTVVEIRHPRTRGGTDTLIVEFRVGSAPHRGVLHLDDSSPTYVVRERIPIIYDPQDPNRFRTEADVNQSPWTVWPMIVALVGGTALLIAGVMKIRRGRRFQRILRGHPWRAYSFRYADRGRNTPLVLVESAEGEPSRAVFSLSMTGARAASSLSNRSGGQIWVAGSADGQRVAALPGPERLIELRPPRSERARRRWLKEFV
jgi:uncharacterized membrane protein (UPF0136 family)